jgi:predicted nucleotidyltransferase
VQVAPGTEKIILFSSLVRQNEINVRDIDLALICPRFYRAAARLLRQEILVDLEGGYLHIRDKIFAEGKILYKRN